jgi:hypothetical protein
MARKKVSAIGDVTISDTGTQTIQVKDLTYFLTDAWTIEDAPAPDFDIGTVVLAEEGLWVVVNVSRRDMHPEEEENYLAVVPANLGQGSPVPYGTMIPSLKDWADAHASYTVVFDPKSILDG